jgi:hypothetical protein
MEVGDQHHAPEVLPSRKETSVPVVIIVIVIIIITADLSGRAVCGRAVAAVARLLRSRGCCGRGFESR